MPHLCTRHPLRLWLGSFAAALALAWLAMPAVAEVTISEEQDGKLAVEIDGKPFTTYWTAGTTRPAMYPIIGPSDTPMTRDYPFSKETPGEAHDHPHHKSFWIAHGDINGLDFWTEGKRNGTVQHRQVLHKESGGDVASLATINEYLGPDGKVICTDTREFWFGEINGSRYIDTRLTFHASHGDIVFGDTKEGMFAFRTHRDLRLSPHKGRGSNPPIGEAVNSAGAQGGAIWGKRAAWVDYWGKIDGHEVGIAIFDHPGNPRHPTWWHARNYGLVAANPFGIHNFENQPAGTGDLKLANGKSLTFFYRVLFHPGDPEQADIEGAYKRFAAEERASILPDDFKTSDKRLGDLKNLNGYFPFQPPSSADAWQDRSKQVRRRILVAAGLWPMLPRPPVRAVVHGLVERDDYTVEKVYLESFPGHFVTGSLYRPREAAAGPRPAVLSPHGHWPEGRFHDHGESEVRKQIAEGGERFEESGRYPIQARCVQLARMGCIVFNYDMVGYADSTQIPFQIAHRSPFRPQLNDRLGWGYFTAQAELRLQNILGLQTFNSLRAVDWIASLPEVDPNRIAVTGCSGGGTQTMLLTAIDPRIAVSFPAVMVSTAMQGGCTCENASCLRVGTGNVEFAALCAPRPLGITGADDWTVEIEAKGLPELRQLYETLDARENLFGKALVHFGHNFNHVSRTLMYQWMNKHLGLGLAEPVLERDFIPLSREELSVWDDVHPRPESGADVEREFLRQLDQASTTQLAALRQGTDADRQEYRRLVREALETIVGRTFPTAGSITKTEIDRFDRGSYEEFRIVLHHPSGEHVPVVFFHPHDWEGDVAVVLHGQGRHALLDPDGLPDREVSQLLDAGISVATADLYGQGERAVGGRPQLINRHNPNSRHSAGYTYGYNHPLFAQRVHDILTLLSFIACDEHEPREVHLAGVSGAGPLVAVARLLAVDAIASTIIDTQGFRFVDCASWRDANFLPGAVKYGDLPGLLAAGSPAPLRVTGENVEQLTVLTQAYGADEARNRLTISSATTKPPISTAVRWLLRSQPQASTN